MKQSLYIGKEPDLQKIIIASAVLHLIFILLVTVPIRTKEKEYQSYFVDLVGPAEIPSPSGNDGSSLKASPPKMIKEKPVSLQSVSREIERIRAISTLSKLKDRKKEEKTDSIEVIKKKIYEERSDEAADAEVAGKIEELKRKKFGDAVVGPGIPGKAASKKNTDYYYDLIQKRITGEWICQNCESEDFEVVISFHINKDGSVDSLKVVRSSGNSFYDNSAMKAIRKASPLPPPVLEDDCEVRFRPR